MVIIGANSASFYESQDSAALMTKFFSFVRSAVTLALLWSLIGVFGYVIFSTINATADAKLEMADTALKRFDHKAATRPYGLPKAEERHIAASVSKFATIPGTVDLAFDRSGNGFILTELGRIFRSTPTGEVDELPYLSLRRETTGWHTPSRFPPGSRQTYRTSSGRSR